MHSLDDNSITDDTSNTQLNKDHNDTDNNDDDDSGAMSSQKVLASIDLAKTVACKRFKLLCFLLKS
jgi:hypothetical protein